MQILVADDHEVVRKGVCAILKSHFEDIECIEATNGQEGHKHACSRWIRRCKRDSTPIPQIPILFFTMNAGEQFASEARKAGVQGFVSKDRPGEDLIRAVETLLRKETFFERIAT